MINPNAKPSRLTSERPWQVERDRFSTMFSGPLEVGEMVEVVPATFHGLLMILDAYYPAQVFTGSSGDVGARLVVLARELTRLREVAQVVLEVCVPDWPGQAPAMAREARTAALDALRAALAPAEPKHEETI